MSRTIAALFCVALAACSGGGGPAAPSGPPGLATPSELKIETQRVTMTSNQVGLSWRGTSSTYRLSIGSNPQMQDVLVVDVTGNSYTWTAPRVEQWYYIRVASTSGSQTSTPSIEVPVLTLDMRNIIDAMYFRGGPMSDTPTNALSNPQAGVWADGTRLQVKVSADAGPITPVNAAQFLNDYAATVSGAISATTEITQEDLRLVSVNQLPPLTIGVRVWNTFCGTGALACANYGPSPIGSNRSMVTLVTTFENSQRAIGHELGHAYGMGHVKVLIAANPELNFMMSPVYNFTGQLSEAEKTAIVVAREAGLRAGWTRSQALAAGLVLPYTPVTLEAATALVSSVGTKSRPLCKIVNGPEG